MDWFTRLTGFRETSYAETQARLEVEGSTLRSAVNGKSYGIGQFEMPSLGELRQQVAAGSGHAGRLRVSIVTGDVRQANYSSLRAELVEFRRRIGQLQHGHGAKLAKPRPSLAGRLQRG